MCSMQRLWLFVGIGLLLAAGPAGFAQAATPGVLQAKVLEATNHGAALKLESNDPRNPITVEIPSPALQTKLVGVRRGDTAKLEVDDLLAPKRVTQVDLVTRPVGPGPASLALFGSLIALFLAAVVASGGKPQCFLIGSDNRYSNSQCQLALWFGAVATVYAAAVVLRVCWLGWDFIGGVGVTNNVIALTGLSALSFGGAKAITGQKVADANALAAAPPPAGGAQPPVKTTAVKPHLIGDLVQNDNSRADLGDFQMILIALTAVLIFVLSSFHFLIDLPLAGVTTLPDVDTTLLSAFGVGQGAYLLKKAASPLGSG